MKLKVHVTTLCGACPGIHTALPATANAQTTNPSTEVKNAICGISQKQRPDSAIKYICIMPVSFSNIKKGSTYSRQALAELWGYASFHAIARGVVTPRDDNKIILFVTEEKQSSAEQYADQLSEGALEWEGPTDHFAEKRMLNAEADGDEIHLFHRQRHHSDFTYFGRLIVVSHVLHGDRSSRFRFQVE